MNIVGTIRFDGHILDVYNDLDKPYFIAADIAKLVDYSIGNASEMIRVLEADEHLLVTVQRAGQNRQVRVVTELGLYNILSQSRKPIARKWRRIVHSNLIQMRRNRNLTIDMQFDEWDAIADDLYVDIHTGILMRSVTMPGGDVEQIPYTDEEINI